MTVRELSQRVERLGKEVEELKAFVKPKPQLMSITPEELARRKKVEAILERKLKRIEKNLRGMTLKDILPYMRPWRW